VKISIDLPPNIVEILEHRAAKMESSLEVAVVEVLKGALAPLLTDSNKPSANSARATGRRVQLPLIRSSHPGTLRSLTGPEIDDLLA